MSNAKKATGTKPAAVDDEVFDLDAVEAEANGARFRFKLSIQGKPHEFSFPPAELVEWSTSTAIAHQRYDEGLQDLLGPTEYAKFCEANPNMTKIAKLFERWFAFMGTTPGK